MRSLSGGDTDAVRLTRGASPPPRQQPTLWPQRHWPAASPRNAATLCAQRQVGRLQEAGEAAAAATTSTFGGGVLGGCVMEWAGFRNGGQALSGMGLGLSACGGVEENPHIETERRQIT